MVLVGSGLVVREYKKSEGKNEDLLGQVRQ